MVIAMCYNFINIYERKNGMKKIISLSLILIMLLTAATPVFSLAASQEQVTPIVYIRGNGEPIYNAQGEEVVADIGKISLGGDEDEEKTKDKIVEAVVNILLPFLTEGLIFDKWDNYGRAIYDEISHLFAEAILDGNGDPQYGTGVPESVIEKSEQIASKDQFKGGKYDFYAYMFRFDWRLDPYEHVDRLHEYIKTVLKATKKSQVSLAARCLGGSLLTAYLEKYGKEGLIKNVMFCDVLSEGCTVISKGFSGQIDFDSKSIQRYVGQLDFCDEIGFGVGFGIPLLADEIVTKTLDLFTQVGVVDALSGSIEELYGKLYKALIPALFHSFGYASQPIYWTFVEEEDFDRALNLMFGEEGSEARTYFAGLIEKINNYRAKIITNRDRLFETFTEDYGIHMGVIAKYGLLNPPFVTGYNELSDGLASLEDSSFGATCANVGSVLSEEYISSRVAAGKGDCISPDKCVDTSTGLFPETTWVIKNVHHDDFDRSGKALAEKFLSGSGITVENSGFARFRINDYSTNTVADMTEDNCADLEWISMPEEEPTTETRLASLMRFLTMLLDFITKLIKGEIDLGNLFG